MSEKPFRRARTDPEVRRAQILDAAIRIVGEHGYHGFTVQELAKRCGITNGALLYYFGSKEQLLVAVLEEHDLRMSQTVVAEAGGAAVEAQRSDSSRAAVLELLQAIVVRAAADPALTRLYAVLQQEALDPAHPAHAYFERREQLVLETFALIVAPHVADPPAAARELFAMIEGLEQRWLRARQAFNLVAAWDHAVAKLLPACGASQPD
ncbi:helix-turn-helix domain containing protein [Phenylobacterium sp. LjRoot219]|uniref:TetR/AcrR family transcriptional regulator n=1 Tax=Phenylobacterium sp. LjRoot219 TaxID=3342283 RepID=UPI003ECE2710